MKTRNKVRLQQDLIEICDQIGILANDRPKLFFNRDEMNKVAAKHENLTANRVVEKGKLGKCLYSVRSIFVNEHPTLRNDKIGRIEYFRNSKKYKYKVIGKSWNYAEQKHTLVHELVHYRFSNMNHGYGFNERIKEILRGRRFEPKHIHFFETYARSWTYLIDSSTNEEIQKYLKTQEKATATREEYNRKCRLYWQVHNQLKDKIKELDLMTQNEVSELLRTTNNRRLPIDQGIERLRKRLELIVVESKKRLTRVRNTNASRRTNH